MAKKMIKVRAKLTGLVERVSEQAWPLFAEHYDRLDGKAEAAPDPAPPAAPAPSAPNTSRTPRPAATPGKE